MRSKNMIENTTSTPATAPIISDDSMLTQAHGAVMATSPARQPLSVMPISGFFKSSQAVAVEVSVAAAAAAFVFTATKAISEPSPTAIVLPGLKPNQPSHSTKQPMKAAVMLWPGMACTLPSAEYFPIRGPRMNAPVSAAQPPTEWTTVEPAKSQKPPSASQPPPQIQCPVTGYKKIAITKLNTMKE